VNNAELQMLISCTLLKFSCNLSLTFTKLFTQFDL